MTRPYSLRNLRNWRPKLLLLLLDIHPDALQGHTAALTRLAAEVAACASVAVPARRLEHLCIITSQGSHKVP